MTDTWDPQQLRAGLDDLGVGRGDHVVVHSSLRSIGRVAGGAEAVLELLIDVLGPSGTLVLPTFNYRPNDDGEVDLRVTPGQTGAISEAGRRRADARRSDHPTHSLVGIGRLAPELTAGHLVGRAMGPDSPLGRLARHGGKVLLLGVGHTSNTMLHVAEEVARVPKPDPPQARQAVTVTTLEGRALRHTLDSSPSCSMAFGTAERVLRQAGVVTDGRIGGALCQLMPAAEVLRVIGGLLREQPDALLCGWSGCHPCHATRAALHGDG